MAEIEMTGPRPMVVRAMSGRFVWVGAGVLAIFCFYLIFGYYRRSKAMEKVREADRTSLTASGPAHSNRTMVDSAEYDKLIADTHVPDAPPPFVPQQGTAGGSKPSTFNPDATLNQRPSPFTPPVNPANLVTQVPYQTPGQGYQDTPAQRVETRNESRLLEAIEAPSGAGQTQHNVRNQLATSLDSEASQMAARLQQSFPSGVPQQSPFIGQGDGDQNKQVDKMRFQSEAQQGQQNDYLSTRRVAAASKWVLQRGEDIPATLPTELNSDLPGDITAIVFRDVLDSPTHSVVLIPAGSRLVGEYNSNVAYAQNRVQVAWTAIYFRDGSFIDIGRMPAHSADGTTGLKDKVDNHLKRLIGGVALSSMLAAGLQLSQHRTNSSVLAYPSTGQEIASAVGSQAAQLGQQITSRNLNVQPTLQVRPGDIFSVKVNRDMIFPGPYEPMRPK